MNQPKQPTDLDLGRDWLDRAAFQFDHIDRAAFPDALDAARTAATIGHGYVALAHASQSLEAMAATARRRQLFDTAAEREERAEAEARPHDDELSIVYVVEGEETGVLHVAATEDLAKAWIADADHGSYLAITATAVDRG